MTERGESRGGEGHAHVKVGFRRSGTQAVAEVRKGVEEGSESAESSVKFAFGVNDVMGHPVQLREEAGRRQTRTGQSQGL